MSSMVIEFTRKEDLEQACYEVTLDLNLYINHLLGIAERCEKHFPEVAHGLRGSAAGIGQYLRGIDGDWKHGSQEKIRETLAEPEFCDQLWAYEFARDPQAGLILLGAMMGIAAAKPYLTFYETLVAARTKMMDFAPLIEELLNSSPRRTQ